MGTGLTFRQAVWVAAVPAMISAAATYYARQAEQKASNIELMQSVKQARITERDLIQHEAIQLGEQGYLIPVADNLAWSNYYHCRKEDGSRLECARRQKQVIPKETPSIVAVEFTDGY